MTQTERRKYLIAALLKEHPQYTELEIPSNEQEQKALLRSLFKFARHGRALTGESPEHAQVVGNV